MHQPTPALRERRPPAAHASRTAGFLAGFARILVVAAAAALFLAFVGAFGTGAEPIGRRLVYWPTVMLATTLVGAVVVAPAYLAGWVQPRPILRSAILGLVISIPQTVVVWALGPLLLPGSPPWDPKALPAYYGPVLGVAAAMMAIAHLVIDRMQARARQITHAAPAGAAPPKFLERLPLKLRGGELYAVEAEDHYLRLHTSKGSDLILMRLADAIAELDGMEGARTHRSWWVAKAAVSDAKRADGRGTLTLKNGVEAPVSRSYASALRQAGWF